MITFCPRVYRLCSRVPDPKPSQRELEENMVRKDAKSVAADAVLAALRNLEGATGSRRSELLKAAAAAIVEMRRQYEWEGRPDWTGRHPEYREQIARLYREGKVPPDSENSTQAAIRYSIGNALREVAPPADLEALGLSLEGPRARTRRARAAAEPRKARSAAPRRLVRAPGPMADGNGRTVLVAVADPVALVNFARDAIAAVQELKPRADDAVAVEPLLRALAEEVFTTMVEVRGGSGKRARSG